MCVWSCFGSLIEKYSQKYKIVHFGFYRYICYKSILGIKSVGKKKHVFYVPTLGLI